MPKVTYDPSASVIVVDLLLESADGASFLLLPVVLDTGASFIRPRKGIIELTKER